MGSDKKEKTYTRIGIFDIDGVFRGKLVNTDKLKSIQKKGFGFCNVIFAWDINDSCYTELETSKYPDEFARLDPGSLRQIPWQNNRDFYLADFSGNSDGLSLACPRALLKKVVKKAHGMGYHPYIGVDYEWFNFLETPLTLEEKAYANPQPISPGMFGYSTHRLNVYKDYVDQLLEYLNLFGIDIEGFHTETGSGVYEAAIQVQPVLKAADNAALFKMAVKEIANDHGIIASFMAKLNATFPGCSGHLHQSIWDKDKKTNLFKNGEKLSPLAESYLAGQLHCLPYIMPMYAPVVNSYKRYIKGSWAATTCSWGYENRTTAFRVISEPDEKAFRIELRVPGADANPYLAMAAGMASGLYGIENKLKLDIPATQETEYTLSKNKALPKNLGEAIHAMENSDIPKKLFGKAFTKHFLMTRKWEWELYNKAVTNWELKRYFELI